MIKLSFFQASVAAYVKLRLAVTANRLNVEHRTSNIERRILMALRFIEFKTSESQPATSPSVVSTRLKNSGSNDSAESNPPKADKSRRMVLLCTAFLN
jgi:hypothetical protein